MTKLSPAQEAEIVTRLARGDTQVSIHKDTGIAVATISRVRERQADSLAVIDTRLRKQKLKITSRLLEKTHQILEARLNRSIMPIEGQLAIIDKWFEETEKTPEDYKVYKTKIGLIEKQQVSTHDLIAISKEMFVESRVEDGRPTNVTYNADAKTTKDQLDNLLAAIQNGDEIGLIELENNAISDEVSE